MGGKLGVDVTGSSSIEAPQLLESEELQSKIKELIDDVVDVSQFMRHTKNPITVISIHKKRRVKEYFEALSSLSNYLRVVIFIDVEKNDINNAYMLIWRVVNNIDAARDIFISGLSVGVDGTNKSAIDGFTREWPGDVECTPSVVESLKTKGLWSLDDELERKYQL